jgi:4-amino-4-deoxy-L-arabinose transferase-like glycosyltransferase
LTGLIAGALVAFYPPLVYYPKQVSPAILSAFFAAFSLYILLMLLEKPTWTKAGLTGILSGLALHVEPVLLLALPGTALFEAAIFSRLPWRIIGRKLLVAAAVCGMVLIPWALRNLVVFQQWVPLKTSFGLNLWMGNNPQATGMLYTADGTPMPDTLSPDVREHLATLNEAQRYSALAHRAWTWIQEHPGRFLQLTAVRIRYLWWISPTYQTTAEAIVEPQLLYAARMWTQAVVVMLGFAGGIVALLRNRRLLVHCSWWMVAFTVPYAITVAGNTRYRLPAEPMILILIAFGLAEGIRRIVASHHHVQRLEVSLW